MGNNYPIKACWSLTVCFLASSSSLYSPFLKQPTTNLVSASPAMSGCMFGRLSRCRIKPDIVVAYGCSGFDGASRSTRELRTHDTTVGTLRGHTSCNALLFIEAGQSCCL